MSDLRQDLRIALRALARRKGFVAVVVLTLALGIGANSAIFSVVNAVLLKPLPYRQPERLAPLPSRWLNLHTTSLPAAARVFTPEEDIPNGPPVVMLGFDLWQRRFGGDPAIVNQVIRIDGQSATVVGVMPSGFRFPLEFQSRTTAQVIQPIQSNRSAPVRGNHGQY